MSGLGKPSAVGPFELTAYLPPVTVVPATLNAFGADPGESNE